MSRIECADPEIKSWIQEGLSKAHYLLGDGTHSEEFPSLEGILLDDKRLKYFANDLWAKAAKTLPPPDQRAISLLATIGSPGFALTRRLAQNVSGELERGRREITHRIRLAGAHWESPRHLEIDPAVGLNKSDGVLLCDDMIWSGHSMRQLYNTISMSGARVIGVVVMITREGAMQDLGIPKGIPIFCSAQITSVSHLPSTCPDIASLKPVPRVFGKLRIL